MGGKSEDHRDIRSLLKELDRLRQENRKLREQLGIQLPNAREPEQRPRFSQERKVKLFRELFRGRQDIYAVRWVSRKTGRSGYSPARRRNPASSENELLPLTEQVIRAHLQGRITIGVYPLLKDETFWFVAVDFDKASWREDCTAFRRVGRVVGIDTPVERRINQLEAQNIIAESRRTGPLLGVYQPPAEEEDLPLTQFAFSKRESQPCVEMKGTQIQVTQGTRLFLEKAQVPPGAINRVARLASFPNPEFFRFQAMRLSTFGKPRIICCAEDNEEQISLPRGCLPQLQAFLKSCGARIDLVDARTKGSNLSCAFGATLFSQQQEALQAVLRHEIGVLVAPPAFGKTVVAAAVIAERQTNTLVLVHRRQLLEQWLARLGVFLRISRESGRSAAAGTDPQVYSTSRCFRP